MLISKDQLQVNSTSLKLPKVIVYDVPSDLSEECGKEIIYDQNSEIFSELPREAFVKQAKLDFKTGMRNWVMEVSSTVRNILRRNERVYIESY